MKQKYYLRGIGVGILFATIVLFVAYLVSGRGKMTDEEVIKRAEELGMVTTESVLSGLDTPSVTGSTENKDDSDTSLEKDAATKEAVDVTTEATTKATTEATTEANTKATTEATTKATTEAITEATTKATTEEVTEAATKEATEEVTETTTERPGGSDKVTFTVVSGMDSYSVAKVLEDRGVIKDAADFDYYLEQNGYSSRIATGEYSVKKGADYETIAKMLVGGN
ncbi:MAG: endolytic transglycosylase MltG [Lachnospiraceae bacterium]|nr:endolytic transglycosylase MltG [Lachnospiraceae bacterium]